MARVVHFEIPADDPDRANTFYKDVFNWTINKWDGPQDYWLITTGEDGQPGINGGMMSRQQPGQGVVNTIQVDSLDDTIAAIQKAGGNVAVEKMEIPNIGFLAYCTDTEGNMFGIMQPAG
jgi:hypothetical protein